MTFNGAVVCAGNGARVNKSVPAVKNPSVVVAFENGQADSHGSLSSRPLDHGCRQRIAHAVTPSKWRNHIEMSSLVPS